jgi:hypothetical protein
MEGYAYKYRGLAHAQGGGGYIGIIFEREDGGRFTAMLSVDDAKLLIKELPAQIRSADS